MTDTEKLWQSIVMRDVTADGRFYFGVATSGIYCRPSCPARRPNRENVRFFRAREAAELDGFRACLRCKPDALEIRNPNQALVHQVCACISETETHLPTLAELATVTGHSPYHVQRTFKAVMGVSPRVYADEKRRKRFRAMVRGGDDVTGAMYEAGYGSPSRLYEDADSWLGMTPASYAKGGKGAIMRYAITDTPLERMIVAATDRGIAFLGFGSNDDVLLAELQGDFPLAEIAEDYDGLGDLIDKVVDSFDHHDKQIGLPLDVRGTAFQAKVWQALQDIPPGETRSYGQIAAVLGKPKAARAVGRACATNPVSLVVPCHRAVGSSGALTGYRWGVDRKRTLLEREKLAK